MSRPRFLADNDLNGAIERLLLIWAASEAEDWAGHVEFLPRCRACRSNKVQLMILAKFRAQFVDAQR